MEIIVSILTLSGISISFWALVGILRYIQEKFLREKKSKKNDGLSIEKIAIIIPAHNEELSIGRTLRSLKEITSKNNIYVGSDASTDKTLDIVKDEGCNFIDIQPNQGKARVLKRLIDHFSLLEKYEAVLIVDADTEIDKNYLKKAVLLFRDPEIVAIAGHAITKWKSHWIPSWPMFFISYRVRLYKVLQAILRYSQTWKYTNVTSIIPGFASIYRTSVLKDIYIDAPGLIIEDYNMTFEVQRKRLGKIGYSPEIFGTCQDPHTMRDYINQVDRWNLGFWQTVKRHGIWPSFFWLALGIFQIEMVIYGFFFLSIPFMLEWFFLNSFSPIQLPFTPLFFGYTQIEFGKLLFATFAADYLITVIVAFLEKKPILLFYGLGFILLRMIDVYMFITNIPRAFLVKSDGRWKSPERKKLD